MLRSETEAQNRTAPSATPVWVGYVLAAVGLTAIVLLVVQNNHDVEFEWLWINFTASLAVVLLSTAVVTMVGTTLIGVVWLAHRHRLQQRTTRDATTNPASDEQPTTRDDRAQDFGRAAR